MELKTTNIKGKEYVMVNERIKAFRSLPEYKGWSLVTEKTDGGGDWCEMKASVIDENGKIRATGYAREVVAKSPINKFAFVENCETSAWGRALGNLGIGVDAAICSAEELLQKMSQDSGVEELQKVATSEKRKQTMEKKAEVKAALHTPEVAKQQYESCIIYLKKLAPKDTTNDAIMKPVNQVISLLEEQQCYDELNKLVECLNSKKEEYKRQQEEEKAKQDSIPY